MYLATQNRSFRLAGAARPRNVSPRRRLSRLGQSSSGGVITPQVAVQEAIQQSGVQASIDPRFLANTAGLQKWYSMIEAGQFDLAWVSPSCVGANAPNSGVTNLSLTQAAGSIAGTATGAAAAAVGGIAAGTAAGVALGAATLGIGAVVAIIGMIFAHHAQAVAQEQHIECMVTGAANNAMSALAEGVQSGQIQPADAVTALNSIYSQYKQIAAPSWGTHPWCNANCELEILMLAMVLYWQAQYTAMADQQAAAAANPVGAAVSSAQGVATSLGLPSWALFAAGAFLLWELV